MYKRLLILLLALLVYKVNAQYLQFNPECVSSNIQTTVYAYDANGNSINVYWIVPPPSTLLSSNDFFNGTSQSTISFSNGTTTIQAFPVNQGIFGPPFFFSINISSNQFSINCNNINECENAQINLSNYVNYNYPTANPISYTFIDNNNNTITNGGNNYIIGSLPENLQVIVTDGTGCTDSCSININPTTTTISSPSIYISNRITQKCSNPTNVTLSINNPNSNYSYKWEINGVFIPGDSVNTFIGGPSYPDTIPITLWVDDGVCELPFYDTIFNKGLISLSGQQFATTIEPACIGDNNTKF